MEMVKISKMKNYKFRIELSLRNWIPLKLCLCTPGTQNQGSTAGALHFRRWWQAQQAQRNRHHFIQEKRIRKRGSLCITLSEYSQREISHITPSIHPLNISSGHEKFLSIVSACLYYDLKLVSSTTTTFQHGICVVRHDHWAGFGNKCRLLKQEIVLAPRLWQRFRWNEEGLRCQILESQNK
jgi:hypothetical protein